MKHTIQYIVTVVLLLCAVGVQGQELPIHWWKTTGQVRVTESIPSSRDYTVVAVYRADPHLGEQPVWGLDFGDSLGNGLTTRSVLVGGHAFAYDSVPRALPVITSVQQSAGLADSLPPAFTLTLGDSVEVSELMYFGSRLGVGLLRRVQTYLAVRHGITLAPVDYVDGQGGRVWHAREDAAYHHRIFGLASDSTYGLRQCEGCSCEDSLLTLRCDTLPEGAYLLMGAGDDDTWKLRSTRAAGQPFTLVVATQDSLALLWSTEAEGTLMLPPIHRDSRGLHFALTAPDSVAYLAFAPALAPKSASPQLNTPSLITHNPSLITIFPNPTDGRYNIDITGEGEAHVAIYNTLGTQVATHHGAGHHEGTLPGGNAYYVVVTTPEGIETHKLVVR